MRQNVRLNAGSVNALADARPDPRLSSVLQGVLPAVAPAGSHALAYGREALRMPPVLQGIRRPVQSEGPHANAFFCQEFPVRTVPQDLCSQVLPSQTSRDFGKLLRQNLTLDFIIPSPGGYTLHIIAS